MTDRPRIYLDHAATSWPKPESVYRAVDAYLRDCGAPAGRGTYREAEDVGRLVATARRRVAELIGAGESNRILFTANGTDSLNLALHGFLGAGQHVVTTQAEHNSVLRPLRFLEKYGAVQVSRVACDGQGLVDPAAIHGAIRSNTTLIAILHASNVTGAIQPVEEIGRIARERGIALLVDAAQSLGHLPLDVARLGVSLLAAPGHKGLLGPLGTGILYLAPGLESRLRPVRQGGTGTRSEEDEQPESLPDKFESGNHNVPGIVGLAAGMEFVLARGIDRIREHERELTEQLLEQLAELPGVRIHGPSDSQRQVGVVSVTVPGHDPQELAMLLDVTARVQTRAGFHCAPQIHAALGTSGGGGTLRLSVGTFTTADEITAATRALMELMA